ncbi:MAG: class I SAM-dependent methyltransferase [Deltaproteobacteria bacterium]|nr:class I SAM-dependent methyltransferase [Deltaproteobacteria bacterium]
MSTISTGENPAGHVCPHQIAFIFDNPIRRIFQNPNKMLRPYISEGDTAIDIGCGPGFFTIEMAKLVGSSGKVIAIDLQEKMLGDVRKKAIKHHVEERIKFFQCEQDRVGLDQKADFLLAYHMVHETPSPRAFLKELKTMLNENGKILIVEPKMHVTQNAFEDMVSDIKELGFRVCDFPAKIGGRNVLIGLKE